MINATHNEPEVSVVMATFNEDTEIIKASIQSILQQSFTNFELLIIDDSTREDTKETIDVFTEDKRVRIIRSNQRFGFVPALNEGLRQAKGEFIARMDGDDIATTNRIELQVSFFNTHPAISVMGGAIDIINQNGKVTAHRAYPKAPNKLRLFSLMRSPLAHPTVMMRRGVLEKGFYYDERFSRSEDLELWLRLMKNGYKISNTSDTLLLYRVSGNLADKRSGENFKYNYKARKKNFSWKHPCWSLISLLISKIYTLLPKAIISMAYKIENKNE